MNQTQPGKLNFLQSFVLGTSQRLTELMNPPGLHRLIKAAAPVLYGSKAYEAWFLDRFKFTFEAGTDFGLMTGFGFTHHDLDRILAQLLRHISSDVVFFDIGANVGFVSMLAASQAKKLNRSIDIHCFEPNPHTLKKLTRHVQENGFSFHVINTALGSTTSSITMSFADEPGNSTLLSSHVESAETTGVVQMTTLDEYCRSSSVGPHIIKIDVEGFEPQVLKGAANTLKQYRPYLLVEVNDRMLQSGGSSAHELLVQLVNAGYALFYTSPRFVSRIAPESGTRVKMFGCPAVELADNLSEYLWDVFAVPQEHASKAV